MTRLSHAPVSGSPFWLKCLPARFGRRLQKRPEFLAAVHNAGWLFADRAFRMAVGVLVGAWVARYLGPSQFGEMAYVLSFVALFGAVAQLGLDSVAVRDMARHQSDSPQILGTVLRLRVLAGFLAWAGAVGLMAILRPGDTQSLLLTAVCASTLALQAADTVDLWFQSQTQSRRTVVAKGYAYLAANALKVLLVLAQASLLAFMFVTAIELALSAAVLWWQYRKFPADSTWNWSRQRALALLRESFPYLVAGVAVLIYMRIDQIMIRSMVGEHELGLYSAMLPLSSALYVVPMALCTSLSPTMARMRQQDPERFRHAIARLFSAMWWLMIPLAASVAALSTYIVTLLYGTAYSGAAPMLALHVFCAVPVALGVAQSIWIVNEGRPMISLYRTVIGAVCNVLLNLLLIPRYGGVGAAAAAVAAQAAAAVFSNLLLAPVMFRLQLSSLVSFSQPAPIK